MKTLPPERQRAIAEYLRSHSLAETRAWLAADGLATSETALSEFFSWYQLRERLARNASVVETLIETLSQEQPTISPERLFEVGQGLFSAMAIEQQDPQAWVQTQKLTLGKADLDLQRQKFRRETCALFLEWCQDRRAAEIAASQESNTTKIERLGQLMFGEDWTQ